MAKRNRQTFLKRDKEKKRALKQQEKTARRAEAKERKGREASRAELDEDPDIAGIVPGPQPIADNDDDS